MRRRARKPRGRPPDEVTPQPPAPPAPPPQDPPPAPPPPPRRTRADYEAEIRDEVAQLLGMTVEEAKQALENKKAADRAAMDEATRVRAEADEEKTKAAQAQARAATATHQAAVTMALLRGGVHPDKLAWAAKLLDVEPGADDAAISTAIDEAKAAVPEVFSGQAPPVPPPGTPPPSSNPPGSPPTPKPPADVKERARALIAQRYPGLAQQGGST